MKYPKLNQLPTSLTVTDKFRGYNHNLKIADGEFYDCLNMVTDYYPMAASAKKYNDLYSFSSSIKGAIQKDGIIYSVVNGVLIRNSSETGLQGLNDSYKQMVSMGAYICIFPDGAYYNTQNPADYGFMGETWEFITSEYDPSDPPTEVDSVTATICDENFTEFQNIATGQEPSSPTDGKLWYKVEFDRETAKPVVTLKKYDILGSVWNTVSPVYIKFKFTSRGSLPTAIRPGDSVHLTLPIWDKKTSTVLAVGGKAPKDEDEGEEDYIVIADELQSFGGSPVASWPSSGATSVIREYVCKLSRRIPRMDYVCEANNRLWGCRYGDQVGKEGERIAHVNEIYACELGNFRNWYKYEGLSTDSWAASVGSDGAWTGAVNFEGKPTFFKEKKVHQVTVSAQGAHRISEFSCDGVQEGSSESLCIVDNVLYYKAPSKFVAFQGGLTQDISYQLSEERYYNCAAGTENGKIYFSVDCDAGSSTPYKIFIYDTAKKLWSRIQNVGYHVTNIVSVLGVNDSDFLFAVAANQIRELTGNRSAVTSYADKWWFETGMIGYEQTDHKYISRFTFRLKMEQGAALDLYIEYDSSGTWEHAGHVNITGTNSFTIPVRPRRCDHLRIRVEGNGETKIYSIARHLAKGSDHR